MCSHMLFTFRIEEIKCLTSREKNDWKFLCFFNPESFADTFPIFLGFERNDEANVLMFCFFFAFFVFFLVFAAFVTSARKFFEKTPTSQNYCLTSGQ